jgi:hypothetical protein
MFISSESFSISSNYAVSSSEVTIHPQDQRQPEPVIATVNAPQLEGHLQVLTVADSKISPEHKSGSDVPLTQMRLVKVAVMCESYYHLNRWPKYREQMPVTDKPSTHYMKRMKFRVPPKSQYIENSETLSHRLKAHKRFYAKHRLRFNQEWQE